MQVVFILYITNIYNDKTLTTVLIVIYSLCCKQNSNTIQYLYSVDTLGFDWQWQISHSIWRQHFSVYPWAIANLIFQGQQTQGSQSQIPGKILTSQDSDQQSVDQWLWQLFSRSLGIWQTQSQSLSLSHSIRLTQFMIHLHLYLH